MNRFWFTSRMNVVGGKEYKQSRETVALLILLFSQLHAIGLKLHTIPKSVFTLQTNQGHGSV